MDFMRAASAALEAYKSGQSTTSLTPVIRDSFDDVLSAFRRFTDRTAHLLSQRYGPDSEEVRVLREAMSQEFDNEFAYRFMYHLRNYSEHRGAPITRIRQASTLGPDGRVEHEFDVLFDSRKLLSYHDWHRQVRADLAGINGGVLGGCHGRCPAARMRARALQGVAGPGGRHHGGSRRHPGPGRADCHRRCPWPGAPAGKAERADRPPGNQPTQCHSCSDRPGRGC